MTILAENRLNITIMTMPYKIPYKFPIHPLKAEEFRQAMPNAPRDNISRKGPSLRYYTRNDRRLG